MPKKNMQSIVAALTPVAEKLPTQNTDTPRTRQRERAKPKPPPPDEPTVQFSFSLRKSLRRELARLADEADMPMRAFILDALRAKGLSVTPDDLRDLRKSEG